MRASAVLAFVMLAALWLVALWLWPGLPARIPSHFDAAGQPDGHLPRSVIAWFFLPSLATLVGLAFAFALPAWIRSMAAKNAPYLNVPRKRDFAALDPAARVRAVGPLIVMLRLVSAEVTLLFGVILLGSARVASGAWQRLPQMLVWAPVLIVLATALLSLPFGAAAVRRELARAAKG